MQFASSILSIVAVFYGAFVTSILLGLVLRRRRNILAEYPISIRFGILIVLATVFGMITLVFGWLILFIVAPVSLCCGIVLLYGPEKLVESGSG